MIGGYERDQKRRGERLCDAEHSKIALADSLENEKPIR